MTEFGPSIAAAFAAGLLGSAHCLGMCAGMSGLFAARAAAASLRGNSVLAATYNFGRLVSYAMLGALVAWLGQSAVSVIPQLAAPLRLISGTMIVLVGLQIAFRWRLLAPLESAGARFWRLLAPLAARVLPVRNPLQALQLGMLWGLLPCGLIYSVLLISATTTDPARGAAAMFAFGLGTLPAMLATGLSTAQLSGWLQKNRVAAGLLVVTLGLATLAMPLDSMLSGEAHQHHNSHSHH